MTGYEKLSPKHRRFVDEYLIHMNSTEAAKAAGYIGQHPKTYGSALYNKPDIRAAIDAKVKAREQKASVTQEEVLRDLVSVKNQALGREMVRDTDGEWIYRYNSAGAIKALELLGKHLGMFTEKLNVTVKSHEDALLELEKLGSAA